LFEALAMPFLRSRLVDFFSLPLPFLSSHHLVTAVLFMHGWQLIDRLDFQKGVVEHAC
jgi:hypothetical protein